MPTIAINFASWWFLLFFLLFKLSDTILIEFQVPIWYHLIVCFNAHMCIWYGIIWSTIQVYTTRLEVAGFGYADTDRKNSGWVLKLKPNPHIEPLGVKLFFNHMWFVLQVASLHLYILEHWLTEPVWSGVRSIAVAVEHADSIMLMRLGTIKSSSLCLNMSLVMYHSLITSMQGFLTSEVTIFIFYRILCT